MNFSPLPSPHRLGQQMNNLSVETPVIFLSPFDQSSVDIHGYAEQEANQFSHVGSVNHSTPQYLSDIIMISLLRVNSMAVIVTASGHRILVDDNDLSIVDEFRWFAAFTSSNKSVAYAKTRIKVDGHSNQVLMHRLLMDAPSHLQVDHINHNGLDNRRSNLRLATHQQNSCNRPPPSNNSSGFRGVTYRRSHNKWEAQIGHAGKKHFLGWHQEKEDAARAYDKAAREIFGEFAFLNFPTEVSGVSEEWE